jgi:hypothetical protein
MRERYSNLHLLSTYGPSLVTTALLQVFWHRRGDDRNQIAADFGGYVVDLASAWAQTARITFRSQGPDGGRPT